MLETKTVNLLAIGRRNNDPAQPYRLKLTHRPTGKSAEGEGVDFDAAKAEAAAKLEKLVAEP